jgi:hypothetical protein
MKDPVADFKSRVVQTPKGATFVYHVGSLASDTASSPTLTNIQMFAYGLHLMGRVGLRQRRVDFGFEYSFVVLQPVHIVDFDTARKTYLDNLKH